MSELKPYNNTDTCTIEKKFRDGAFYTREPHPHTTLLVSRNSLRESTDSMLSFTVLLYLLSVAVAGSVYGRFTGLPETSRGIAPGRNGLNFQSRILIQLEGSTKSEAIPVDKKFKFRALGLDPGLYQLSIDSYDFELKNSKWQIEVSNEDETAAVEHATGKPLNVTSRAIISAENPLEVKVVGTTQYYEDLEGGLSKMLQDSPFGFIFRNRTYTTIFVVCLITMALPYVLLFVNPELAEQINQKQPPAKYVVKEEVEVLSKPQPQQRPPSQVLQRGASQSSLPAPRVPAQGSKRRA